MTLSSADLEAGVADDEVVGKKKHGPRAGGPKRRSSTPEYKLRIVEEHERLTEPGAKGALLRREGLYHSHIIDWRAARDAGAWMRRPPGRPGRRTRVRPGRRPSGCGRRTRSWPPNCVLAENFVRSGHAACWYS